ncbi:MAG: radical SAM protein [Chitinispirillales bacterium]|jgi:MoaA/NifB/PqqE/SkfB family radical SAM enzyme|nr:radical SAM protein [Chitinispirillales bacterium]
MSIKDMFTFEYHKVIELLEDRKVINNFQRKKTFRENSDNSVYTDIAIEIVQDDLCQLSCEWCYIGQSKSAKFNAPLKYQHFKEIIDKVLEYKKENNMKLFSNMALIGGEPTLNPELDKMIEYSLANNLTPILVTNGEKLSDIDYAKKICLDGVVITVHLPLIGEEGDEVLDKLSKKNGYSLKLKKAIENMLFLRQNDVKVKIIGEFVICQSTKNFAFDSYVYCRENDIEPFFELMRISNDSYTNKHLMLEESDIKHLGDALYEYDLKNNYAVDNPLNKVLYYLPPTINSPCTLIQNSIHIKYEECGFGKVVSCCGQSISHGNIMNDSLENIIRHKENTKIFSEQKKHIKGPCSECLLYDLVGCEGGCRGNAKNTFGCAEASDPQCIFISSDVRVNKDIMINKNSACAID